MEEWTVYKQINHVTLFIQIFVLKTNIKTRLVIEPNILKNCENEKYNWHRNSNMLSLPVYEAHDKNKNRKYKMLLNLRIRHNKGHETRVHWPWQVYAKNPIVKYSSYFFITHQHMLQ